MARVLATTLIGVAAAFLASGSVAAQQDAFEEGVKLYRLGRLEEALQKFEEVLAEDPTNEEAFEIWKRTDEAVWRALLLEEGEIQQIATHIIDLARRGRAEQSRDEGRIRELVERATTGDYGQRRKAQVALMSDHGEFAVPALVRELGDQDDDQGQIHAIMALQTIGRAATLPLLEALESDDVTVRFNAVSALRHIEDERALPVLAALAENDPSEAVRDAAARTVEKLGGGGRSPVRLYLSQAERYLRGVRERSEVIWSHEDGELVARDVPSVVYHYELAKKMAHDALRMQPDDRTAKVLLARAYLGEIAAIENSLAAAPGDAELQAAAGELPALEMAASATGTRTIRRALQDSLEAGMVPAAVTAIAMLGEMESPDDLAGSPLVAALGNDDKRVAYAAALAVTRAARGNDLPARVSRDVVRTLATAVGEESIRNIKVIDPASATQRAVAEAAFDRGIAQTVDTSASKAIEDLYRNPNVDVVVISETLPDAAPEAVIGLIRKDPRMEGVKIVVASLEPAAARKRFGDRVDAVVEAPLSGETLRAAVESALAGVPLDQGRARADQVAVAASEALRSLGSDNVDLGPALDSLAGQLDRDDGVAIPAARALGYGGSLTVVPALIGTIERADASLDLKVAAAEAIGDVLARSGSLERETFDRLLAVLRSGADVRLRQAVAKALGKAQLGSDLQLELLNVLGARATSGASGD